MNIGDKVIVNFGEETQIMGIYAGTAIMQRYENEPLQTMAIVRLSSVDSGYLHSGGNAKPLTFINSVIVHPDNLKVG